MGDQLILRPRQGTLKAHVFKNPNVGIRPTLFFKAEIPLAPFEYDGEMERTSVRLDFIKFRVRDWRDLSGKNFTFPINPEPGYIDGSLYLGGAHNPADVTRIECYKFEGDLLEVEIDVRFDFTVEGLEGLGVVAVSWPTELAIDPVELDAAFAEAKKQNAL